MQPFSIKKPFLPDPDPDECYAIIIGQCPQEKAPAGFVRYMVASIRGTFQLREASKFMVDLLDNDEIPRYEHYFSHPRIRVHTVGMS